MRTATGVVVHLRPAAYTRRYTSVTPSGPSAGMAAAGIQTHGFAVQCQARITQRAPAERQLLRAVPNPDEDTAITDSIGPTLAAVGGPAALPTDTLADCTNGCARDVRHLTGHLVAEELDGLIASLTGRDDGGRIDPLAAELVRETARSLDRFIRQGRLPCRADLYSFRAIAALAGAAGYNEDQLVAVVEECAEAVRDL